MTWVKLDDGFFRNRKARKAGKDGRALFLAGLCHCASALTDGHIGTYDLPVIAAEAEVKNTAKLADTLVNVGLWIKAADGWTVKDYNLYNRSAADVRKERDEGRERAARSRERRANRNGTDEGSSTDPSSSSSSPLGFSSVNGSSSSNSAQLDEDDEWFTIIAKRRLAKREAEKGAVTRPRSWMTTTTKDVRDEHDQAATSYLASHPDATALDVANHLEPPVGARRKPAPERTDCPDCHGTGWVEPDDGPAVRCTHRAAS